MWLLIGFKADINLQDKVTRGMRWEGATRADGLYTLCTNLHAYSQIPREHLLLASVDHTTLRPHLIFLLLEHSITGPRWITQTRK